MNLRFPSVKVSEILYVEREYLVEDYIKKLGGGVINSIQFLRYYAKFVPQKLVMFYRIIKN
jgi:hypothetical protein